MTTARPAKLHYLQATALFIVMAATIPIVDLFSTRPAYATDPPPACKNLTANQSDDKNYYNMTVTATAAKNSDIRGYQFNFGDHQSYTFNFSDKDSKDRRSANVKHTYQKAGQYTVTVKVLDTQGDQSTRTDTAACTLAMTIGEASEFPATGPNFTTMLVIAGTLGIMVYAVALEDMRKVQPPRF